MARIRNTRKARFQSALARTGLTQASWAKRHGSVSRVWVNMVLNGKIESPKLASKIDAFIERIESQVAA